MSKGRAYGFFGRILDFIFKALGFSEGGVVSSSENENERGE